MTDWHEYWNTSPDVLNTDDLLRQVGKTVKGNIISEACVEALVNDIITRLQVDPGDRVLDLCCGNGLITRRCSAHCRSIVGVDFSKLLVQVASANFGGPAVSFSLADVCDLPREVTAAWFDKIYMYEALQHLTPPEALRMLQRLRQSASGQAPVLLASVPDEECLWNFYNTPARREDYARRKAEGNEAIGHWWTKTSLASIAKEGGYQAEFTQQNPILHTAHYRFDALLRPIVPA